MEPPAARPGRPGGAAPPVGVRGAVRHRGGDAGARVRAGGRGGRGAGAAATVRPEPALAGGDACRQPAARPGVGTAAGVPAAVRRRVGRAAPASSRLDAHRPGPARRRRPGPRVLDRGRGRGGRRCTSGAGVGDDDRGATPTGALRSRTCWGTCCSPADGTATRSRSPSGRPRSRPTRPGARGLWSGRPRTRSAGSPGSTRCGSSSRLRRRTRTRTGRATQPSPWPGPPSTRPGSWACTRSRSPRRRSRRSSPAPVGWPGTTCSPAPRWRSRRASPTEALARCRSRGARGTGDVTPAALAPGRSSSSVPGLDALSGAQLGRGRIVAPTRWPGPGSTRCSRTWRTRWSRSSSRTPCTWRRTSRSEPATCGRAVTTPSSRCPCP